MEDREFDLCMERMRQGDKDALKEIYQAYAAYLYHQILHVLGNRENAEDVTSDLFIKLWDIADKYEPGNGHRAWLSRIAHNMAVDYLRANKREVPYENMTGDYEGDREDGEDGVLSVTVDSFEDQTADEVIESMAMEELLSNLKPAEREIIHLKIAMQMTFEEISTLLQMPMGTVTWRYREAIKKLRRCGYNA